MAHYLVAVRRRRSVRRRTTTAPSSCAGAQLRSAPSSCSGWTLTTMRRKRLSQTLRTQLPPLVVERPAKRYRRSVGRHGVAAGRSGSASRRVLAAFRASSENYGASRPHLNRGCALRCLRPHSTPYENGVLGTPQGRSSCASRQFYPSPSSSAVNESGRLSMPRGCAVTTPCSA